MLREHANKSHAGAVLPHLLTRLEPARKFGAAIASIPDAVLGGMTTFLFANVLVSGINIVGNLAAARPAPADASLRGVAPD